LNDLVASGEDRHSQSGRSIEWTKSGAVFLGMSSGWEAPSTIRIFTAKISLNGFKKIASHRDFFEYDDFGIVLQAASSYLHASLP
jgi:hypothetical protein